MVNVLEPLQSSRFENGSLHVVNGFSTSVSLALTMGTKDMSLSNQHTLMVFLGDLGGSTLQWGMRHPNLRSKKMRFKIQVTNRTPGDGKRHDLYRLDPTKGAPDNL